MVSWILSCLLLATVNGQADCTIVYFGSASCAPCDKILPALEQLKREGWDIRAVNAPTRPDLATQYKIDNLPTVIIVSQPTQREVDRIVGAVSYEQLLSRFARAAARNTANSSKAASPGNTARPGNDPSPDNTASSLTTLAQAHANYNDNAPAIAALSPIIQQEQPQLQPASQPVATPTVRGQSPAASGFPMLGATSAISAPAVIALHQLTTIPTESQPEPKQLSLEQAIARAAAATVRIKVEEENTTAYGTGTIVDVHGTEALVLTCGHLFREMKPGSQLSVDLFAGTAQETNALARLIDFKAADEDIGLISFTLPVAIEAVELLPRHSTLQVGQSAFSFGCDHGHPPTRRDTQIRSIDRYLGAANVEIVGAPAVGRSGGGLFDQQGRLIGVCNAACTEEDEGIYAAAEVVYTQIARLGLAHLFDGKSKNSPQLIAAQAATATSPLAEDNIRWPDQTEQPSRLNQIAGGVLGEGTVDRDASSILADSLAAQIPPSNGSSKTTTDAEELICIVRDANGQSRVVTIAGPAPELLQAIRQHSAEALAR